MAHLLHKLPWSNLVDSLRLDPTEIVLPIGKCGRIHITSKATKIKVSMRKFITQDQCCDLKDCSLVTDYKIFSKNKLQSPNLMMMMKRQNNLLQAKRICYFNERFIETILEFAQVYEKRMDQGKLACKLIPTEIPKPLNVECKECYMHPCINKCSNHLIFSMYTRNEIEDLVRLDSIGVLNVVNALTKNYGGQAVGNGYKFLVIYHLLPFYITSNLIISCQYENCEDKWGPLAPNSYLRRTIQEDCDFFTFLPHLRAYLGQDVFMKDMAKTRYLLKVVFRHIYIYVYLMKKYNLYTDFDVKTELYY